MVEGTEIIYGHVYFFYQNGKVVSRSVAIDPEDCRYNKRLLEGYKSDTNLQRVVSYDNGILMYWTRTENDFLDLSGLEGRSLTLVMFDNLKLSALYAPGVDPKLMVTDRVYVTFSHSTRYKNKTGYCPQNGVTGAVIDLAQSAEYTKTQNAEIWLLGDVNGDGRVNAMDYTRLLKYVNEAQPLW